MLDSSRPRAHAGASSCYGVGVGVPAWPPRPHTPIPHLSPHPSPPPVGTQGPRHPLRAGGSHGGLSSVSLTTELSTAGSGGPSHCLQILCSLSILMSLHPSSCLLPPSPGHPQRPSLANRAPEAQRRSPTTRRLLIALGRGGHHQEGPFESLQGPGGVVLSHGQTRLPRLSAAASATFVHLVSLPTCSGGGSPTLTLGAKSESEHLLIIPVHPVRLHWPRWTEAEAGGAGLEGGACAPVGAPV